MNHQSKPLLLVFPFGLLSHYLRCIVLARQLSPYFKIKFVSHAEYNPFVSAEGFSVFESETIDEGEVMNCIKKMDFSWLNIHNMEKSFLNQADAIKRLRPAAVMGDAVPSLKMATEYMGVPYISILNGYMSKYYAGNREISARHHMYTFMNSFPQGIKKALVKYGEAMAFKKVHAAFKQIRTKYNLEYVSGYLDELEGNLTIICDLPVLFPQKRLPVGYTISGPLIYNPPHVKNTFSAEVLNPCKKTIFISMGSTGEWDKITFLNDHYFKKYNIVTAGDRTNALQAQHITKMNFVAAGAVLPHTDLVICHGGNGTISQALSYGIPLLCKTSHFEQEWNVQALEQTGLGICIDAVKDKDMEALIEKWILLKNTMPYNEIRDIINSANLSGTIQDIINAVGPVSAYNSDQADNHSELKLPQHYEY